MSLDIEIKKPQSKQSTATVSTMIASGKAIAVILFTVRLSFITGQTVGRPYFPARMFTTTSFSISMFRVYPLSAIVGGKNRYV
jgi:hypothetical protein